MKEIKLDLYLIRHGESEANGQKDYITGRSPKTPLTELGVKQAVRLGKYLRSQNISFDRVYTSPLIRAKETCDLVLAKIGFSPKTFKTVDALVEMSQGAWEGRLRAEVYTDEVLLAMNTQGKFFTPSDGESQSMVEGRVSDWFEDEILTTLEKPEKIAIFTHCQVIRAFLHYVMGFNDRLIHRIHLDNTSVTKLKFDDSGWAINCINDTTHLLLKEGEEDE